jgi:holo-ACP synthase/triphosphoribosyl-dephospho-CoA synthase
MEDHFHRKDAQFIAENAVRSLLYEASATPKPGLVDRLNNGAHDDMNFFTFIDSTSMLFTYFYDMAHAGLTSRNIRPENLLARLRHRGITAEEEMFSATGGINTHKGLIFSMGIICAACGYLGPPFNSLDAVLQTAAQIAAPALCNDLKGITVQNSITHGQTIFAKFGVTGIRGEATEGFPSVRFWGLPVLRKAIKSGSSYNDAGIETLLHLIANVNDTNIISRSNPETLKTLQTRLQAFLNAQPDNKAVLEYAAHLDTQFINENISPGGCADLLAITYMLHFLSN